jgi:hypothetical protein
VFFVGGAAVPAFATGYGRVRMKRYNVTNATTSQCYWEVAALVTVMRRSTSSIAC